jgi:hypothetical protein
LFAITVAILIWLRNPPVHTDTPVTIGVEPAQQPLQAPSSTDLVNLDGVWYAELAGTGIAFAQVVITQQGDHIEGEVSMLDGSGYARFSGEISGEGASWTFTDMFGNAGRGTGVLRPDGRHMDATVVSASGMVEHQVLHRGHLPN